jgi:uncharacterized membrane protein YbjE (DUF340 family)
MVETNDVHRRIFQIIEVLQKREVAYPCLLYILMFLNGAKLGMSSQSKTSYFLSKNNLVIVNMYIT